jgi:flagellar hook-associated protein 2
LVTKAKNFQNQISAFGQLKSEIFALTDAATAMLATNAWTARTASISNTAAATVSVSETAQAGSLKLDVDALAQGQSNTSAGITSGSTVGAGTLTLQLGTWSSAGSSFSATSASSGVSVSVDSTDTVASLATKINKANAGVVATVFKDGTNDRLLLRSKATGEAAGFRMQAKDTTGASITSNTGLGRFAFDPQAGAFGLASSGLTVNYASNAKARINGLAVTSSTNTLTDNVPGVTINLLATTTTNYGLSNETTAPSTVTIKEDVTPSVRLIQTFVDAYNKLALDLADLTKYDRSASTPVVGLFQGDSVVVGAHNLLRRMLAGTGPSSSSVYTRLSDVGLELNKDGLTLGLNTTKLSAAANNGNELQKMFTTETGNPATQGFARRFSDYGKGAVVNTKVASMRTGFLDRKGQAIEKKLGTNTAEQDKINAKADSFEARLRRQYSSLGSNVDRYNTIGSFLTQQTAQWNK